MLVVRREWVTDRPRDRGGAIVTILITGTDTGVGKTVVTACLAASFAERARVVCDLHSVGPVAERTRVADAPEPKPPSAGRTDVADASEREERQPRAVRALKPVATGVIPGTDAEDAVIIGLAAGHSPMCFAKFAEPLSPHLAAERAGRPIVARELLAWIRSEAGDITLVEGSGGWEVPLSADFRVSDLAVALQAAVVVVARNRLGVLNHTLLTVNAVTTRGLSVLGVALSPAENPDLATAMNLSELRRLLPDVPVCDVAELDVYDEGARIRVGATLLERFGV